ncbi:MAG: PspC domain-containing protein [Archaeoglobaceae archaeon]
MERLYRSRDDKIIFGVCGGLSKYFNVDVTLLRLIFVVGVLLKGVTLLIYIILALITPEEKGEAAEAETNDTQLQQPQQQQQHRPQRSHQRLKDGRSFWLMV